MKTLLDLEYNKAAVIKDVGVKDATKRRLLDLGLTKGASVVLKGKAPLGDPILIGLRGFDLALRKSDAAKILVEG
ncbi:MAG TPA: ferrous iron transport protein A [Clostridiales bacterium]|mgnify:CR=1 FL=1|nr:ferrous iron transport protein A [Clostridiales bacterium]